MNPEELKQKIAEYFAKLPKEAQDVFSSMVWMNTLNEIIAKYNLNSKQTETLGTETTLVLLGIIHINEYKEILKKELELEVSILEKVITEIDENILKTIKTNLEEVFESNVIELADKETPIEKELDPRFSNMPTEVKEAIITSDWKNKLFEIAKNHKLNILQMGIFDDVTVKIMNGTIPTEKYEEELINKMTVGKEEVSLIVKEVNDGILIKIRELMKVNEKVEVKKEEVIEPIKNKITNTEEDIPIPPYKTMEDKLKVATKSDHTVSDYSKNTDPYREAIE